MAEFIERRFAQAEVFCFQERKGYALHFEFCQAFSGDKFNGAVTSFEATDQLLHIQRTGDGVHMLSL
jgi:hypothetical protein